MPRLREAQVDRKVESLLRGSLLKKASVHEPWKTAWGFAGEVEAGACSLEKPKSVFSGFERSSFSRSQARVCVSFCRFSFVKMGTSHRSTSRCAVATREARVDGFASVIGGG